MEGENPPFPLTKTMCRNSRLIVVLALAIPLVGCHGTDMTQDEIDRAAHSKPPSKEQLAKWGDAMQHEAAQNKSNEKEWIKSHTPEQIAQVNEARAKRGLKPLGQE